MLRSLAEMLERTMAIGMDDGTLINGCKLSHIMNSNVISTFIMCSHYLCLKIICSHHVTGCSYLYEGFTNRGNVASAKKDQPLHDIVFISIIREKIALQFWHSFHNKHPSL